MHLKHQYFYCNLHIERIQNPTAMANQTRWQYISSTVDVIVGQSELGTLQTKLFTLSAEVLHQDGVWSIHYLKTNYYFKKLDIFFHNELV